MITLTEHEIEFLKSTMSQARLLGRKVTIEMDHQDMINGSIKLNTDMTLEQEDQVVYGEYMKMPSYNNHLDNLYLRRLFKWHVAYHADANGWICLFNTNLSEEDGRWYLNVSNQKFITLYRKENKLIDIASFYYPEDDNINVMATVDGVCTVLSESINANIGEITTDKRKCHNWKTAFGGYFTPVIDVLTDVISVIMKHMKVINTIEKF